MYKVIDNCKPEVAIDPACPKKKKCGKYKTVASGSA